MVDKTLKEEIEAMDKRTVDYCNFIEKELEPISEIPFCDFSKGERDLVGIGVGLQFLVYRTKNLAWAAQRFPIIDLAIFNQIEQKPIEIEDRQSGKKPVNLWLPKWAVTHYPACDGATVSWRPTEQLDVLHQHLGMKFPQQAIDQNNTAMEHRWAYLTTPVPATPLAIRRRVDPFVRRFDHVMVVAEANWSSLAQKDPLVVGVFNTGCGPYSGLSERFGFLLGEYDPSKLEKYVIAEFAIKPKE